MCTFYFVNFCHDIWEWVFPVQFLNQAWHYISDSGCGVKALLHTGGVGVWVLCEIVPAAVQCVLEHSSRLYGRVHPCLRWELIVATDAEHKPFSCSCGEACRAHVLPLSCPNTILLFSFLWPLFEVKDSFFGTFSTRHCSDTIVLNRNWM